MKISHPVYDMLNIMCSDFYGNILKNVEYITKSVRGLVRSFGQCSINYWYGAAAHLLVHTPIYPNDIK